MKLTVVISIDSRLPDRYLRRDRDRKVYDREVSSVQRMHVSSGLPYIDQRQRIVRRHSLASRPRSSLSKHTPGADARYGCRPFLHEVGAGVLGDANKKGVSTVTLARRTWLQRETSWQTGNARRACTRRRPHRLRHFSQLAAATAANLRNVQLESRIPSSALQFENEASATAPSETRHGSSVRLGRLALKICCEDVYWP